MENNEERLDKLIAKTGTASRRGAAELIKAGKVTVDDNKVTEPGFHITGIQSVKINGQKPPEIPETKTSIALNKPRGYICSTSARHGKTIYSLLPSISKGIVPAGRLDKNSEGLLILSNDGKLINLLTHPRYKHTKTYRVTISGREQAQAIKHLKPISELNGKLLAPFEISHIKSGERQGRSILEFHLREGRKRQIREMCDIAGLKVHRLVRTNIGNLSLKELGLKPGGSKELTSDEIARSLGRSLQFA